jgi:hypothetical protein
MISMIFQSDLAVVTPKLVYGRNRQKLEEYCPDLKILSCIDAAC